jgi:hypothetical protein
MRITIWKGMKCFTYMVGITQWKFYSSRKVLGSFEDINELNIDEL